MMEGDIMKRIIALLIALVLVSSFVVAQGQQGIHEPGTGIEQPEVKEAGQGTGQGQPELISAGEQEREQEREMAQTGEQIREQNRQRLQTGLENALTRVTNENARQRLQQNMERFQERYQERMQRMEGLEVEEVDEETGAVRLRAREEVRFLGFIKGKATKRFNIDNQGNIEEKHPWYRFLYRESQPE